MDNQQRELYKVMQHNSHMDEVIYYDENQETFKSCMADNMKTRWDYLADLGFNITEIITFHHKKKAFVRMIIDNPEITCRGIQKYISRVDFALEKLTYGVSYIIPMSVWEKRGEEIKMLFN